MSDELKEIIKRLDTVVFLLLELKDKEGKMLLKEKIRLLNEAGLDYTHIARVLGRDPGSVAVQLTMMKKEGQKKAKEEVKTEVKSDA